MAAKGPVPVPGGTGVGGLLDACGQGWAPAGVLLDACGRGWTPAGGLLDACGWSWTPGVGAGVAAGRLWAGLGVRGCCWKPVGGARRL